MIRFTLISAIVLSVLTGACSGRRTEASHRDIIQEKELVRILTEVHIGDGLLSLPDINFKFSGRDTLSTYIDIIDRYGYTKEDMDRTMRYYFMRKPKKLIRIYDKVLGSLSEMESRIEKEIPLPKESGMWTGKSYYYFPGPESDSAWFEIPVSYPGRYYLRFTLTIFPDDQSIDPRPGIFYCHADSADAGSRFYVSDFPYLKDGIAHNYNFMIPVAALGNFRIMGWFTDQEKQSPDRENHMIINNIILSMSPI